MEVKQLKKLPSSKLVEAILNNNTLSADFDTYGLWENLSVQNWVKMLSVCPKFANKCKLWKDFNSTDINNLLFHQSQFWAYFPEESVKTIIADVSKYAECKCRRRFRTDHWLKILMVHPQLANQFNKWYDLDSYEWALLLSAQPQLVDEVDDIQSIWGILDEEDWNLLLAKQPQFWIYSVCGSIEELKKYPEKISACKCLRRFKVNDWVNLLAVCPQFANKCSKWKNFKLGDWVNLLTKQPHFITECKLLKEFRIADWCKVLSFQPQLISKFSQWDSLYSWDWSLLLSAQPQFSDRCNIWKDFDYSDWTTLLSKQPQFIEKFNQIQYDLNLFDSYEWNKLLSAQPQFFELATKSASGWSSILRNKPEFFQQCNVWEDFNTEDWINLLSEQPHFADKCNIWEDFDDLNWEILLYNQPELWVYNTEMSVKKINEDVSNIKKCKSIGRFEDAHWDKIEISTWVALLSIYPHLVDKFHNCSDCSFEDFSIEDWVNLLEKQTSFIKKAKEFVDGQTAILMLFPEMIKDFHYDFESFESLNWDFVLNVQPQLWKYCPKVSIAMMKSDVAKESECLCWDWFSIKDWFELALINPACEKICWEDFNEEQWVRILSEYPLLADKCDLWQYFDSHNWNSLLLTQPRFILNCDWNYIIEELSDLEDSDQDKDDIAECWSDILWYNPKLLEFFPEEVLDLLSFEQWSELEAKHPGVFEEKHMLSSLRKLCK